MSAVSASLGEEAGKQQVQSASALGLGWRSEMCRYPLVWLEAQPRDDEYHSGSYQIYSTSTFCTFTRLPSTLTLKRQARWGFLCELWFSGWPKGLHSEGLVRSAEKQTKQGTDQKFSSREKLKYNLAVFSSTKSLLSETNSWNLNEEPSYFPAALGSQKQELILTKEGVKDTLCFDWAGLLLTTCSTVRQSMCCKGFGLRVSWNPNG